MVLREELLNRLNELLENKPTQVWVIFYKGKFLSFSSGKSSWKSIGAAKNALRHYLPTENDWRERLKVIKELEDEGVIKYIQLI